jgi:hypothetical protein
LMDWADAAVMPKAASMPMVSERTRMNTPLSEERGVGYLPK